MDSEITSLLEEQFGMVLKQARYQDYIIARVKGNSRVVVKLGEYPALLLGEEKTRILREARKTVKI